MKRLAFLLIGSLLLNSCMLAPKYERAPGEVSPEYRFQSEAANLSRGLPAWRTCPGGRCLTIRRFRA